jgi:hypothetical protein
MVTGTTSIDELLEVCSAGALAATDDESLVRLAKSVFGLWPQLDAARLRLIAEIDARKAFRAEGARDAAAWVADRAGDRRGAARREVELAAAVSAMAPVAGGLADGSLSKAKATELARASAASAVDQAELVEVAKRVPVEEVARRVDRWMIEHAAGPEPVEETCTITPTPGGGRVEARLSAESLEWVQVALDAAADKLGRRDVPWERRRAKGLVGVCRYFLEHADVPSTRVGRPTVVVTVDVETLGAKSGGSARMDSGAYVSGDVGRRLACDAGIVRLITDPESMPLDLGRKTRVPSPAQCRAVIHRDGRCRFHGCTAPPWACEVHHLDFWGRDHGRTDLDRLALICWHHHSLVHDQSDTHDLVDGGDGRLQLRRRERRHHESNAA